MINILVYVSINIRVCVMDEEFEVVFYHGGKFIGDGKLRYKVLEVVHKRTDEVKRVRKNTLIQEYEMLKMFLEENIYDV